MSINVENEIYLQLLNKVTHITANQLTTHIAKSVKDVFVIRVETKDYKNTERYHAFTQPEIPFC